MLQRKQLAALAERDTNRLEAFSDGVFAIAITLLVLNIHIPDAAGNGDLGQALRDQWPSYLAYLLSFLTILNLWVNHHNTFNFVARTDHWFLFINGLLLMGVCVLPFPTALLAQYFSSPTNQFAATLIYAGVFTYNGLAFFVLWSYAASNMRLLDKRLDPAKMRQISVRYLTNPPLYALALVLVFIYPLGTLLIYFLLMVFYMLPLLSMPGPEDLYLEEIGDDHPANVEESR